MKGLILVLGSDGLVGSRFVELSPRKNFLHLPKEVELDITKPWEIKDLLKRYNFSAVVNFAAYTNVNEAEKQRNDERGNCWKVNVEGVRNLVDAINPNITHFIQISTDMVFSGASGDPGPYSEEHPVEIEPEKVTWYGWTKLQGEKYATKVLGKSATIVRITYPVRAYFPAKKDFLRKALELYDGGKLYPLITDQQISFTFVDEAANALDKIITGGLKGIFHVSCPDTTTPHKIVSYMLEKVRSIDSESLETTTLHELMSKTGASVVRYPKYAGLKTQLTQKDLGMDFLPAKRAVDELIKQGIDKH